MSFEHPRRVALDDIIPQRFPFQMIDCVTYIDTLRTETELSVKEDNIFISDGALTAPGLTENIAQTCAARIGFLNLMSGEPVKLGFIGAIRNLVVHRTPKAGELLRTTITVKEEVFGMTLVDADIFVEGENIVTAEMKIALSNIEAV